MSNPKVFEFAKEIGMETLTLMAKIREWQLPIKSHMAELTPDLVEQINVRLNPPKESNSIAKKATTKKKAVASASTKKTSHSTPEVVTIQHPASHETQPSSTLVSTAVAASSIATQTNLSNAGVSRVVRRKASSQHAEPELKKHSVEYSTEEVQHEEIKNQVDVEIEKQKNDIEAKLKLEAQAFVKRSSEEKANEQKEASVNTFNTLKNQEPSTRATNANESSQIKEINKSTGIDSHSEKVVTSTVNVTSPVVTPIVAPHSSPSTPMAPAVQARKKEVVVGQSGFASSQKPANEVVRRNIIGRMDLSRVAPPPSSQTGGSYQGRSSSSGSGGGFSGGGGGSGHTDRFSGGGARTPMAGGSAGGRSAPGSSNQRGVRTGFVSTSTLNSHPIPPDIESQHYKSKFEDRGKKFSKTSQNPENPGSVGGAEEEEVAEFISSEFRKREMVFQPKKKKGLLNRESLKTQITVPKASKRILKVETNMKLSDVAETLGVKAAQLTKILLQNGVIANISTVLDFDTIALIAPEFGWEAQNIFKSADEILDDTSFGNLSAELVSRPPVVTVMGHVDHGKTSLLDAIRKTDVAAGEAGGITQHIGAYQVKLENGQFVTFLDTPGHEAFTSMRARGANATDIAVIVVAADDGVMPQTAEAINHAKAAQVPIVIAVNKIDKPGANVDRIKQQLTEFEIVPEEWGGTHIFCEVSAIKKTGVKELLEQLLLVAEMQDIKANPERSGTGIVIESCLDKGRGSVATVLVKDGTVKVGDLIIAGTTSGRVRSMMNDKGEKVDKALPGQPVEILGLTEVPLAGEKFDIVKDEKTLDRVLQVRKEIKAKAQNVSSKLSIEEIFSKAKDSDLKYLNIILKADVMGSSEAIQGMFQKINTQEVKLKVIHTAVGGITEGDVLLAKTSKAVIVGFNTRPDSNAQAMAKQNGVEIRTYSIVYELVDDLKRLMSGLLEPEIVEEVHGRAEVRNTFTVPKIGTIAGCAVLDGKVSRSHLVRLIRNGVVAYQGKISSLKRFKDDAKEVLSGYECGIGIENYNDLKVGDIIEAYTREEKQRTLTEIQP